MDGNRSREEMKTSSAMVAPLMVDRGSGRIKQHRLRLLKMMRRDPPPKTSRKRPAHSSVRGDAEHVVTIK